jgi:lipoprotein-anchoring transpeptidase ErfK/SrfK
MRARTTCTALITVALLGGAIAVPSWSGHDNKPPQTTITAGPGARTTDRTPTFRFRSSEKNSRFVCKRDGKRFKPCRPPVTLRRLTRGRHGFYVRAIDKAFNRDPTAAAYGFKVVKP